MPVHRPTVMTTLSLEQLNIPLLTRVHPITLPTPFPVGPVHAYLLVGELLTLVDAGPDTAAAWTALQAGLSDLGYRVSDLQRILITHAHVDHYGLSGRLAKASKAEVWAHPEARPTVEGWPDYRAHRERHWRELLTVAGVPASRMEAAARRYRGFRGLQRPTAVHHELTEGQQLIMAGACWQVLHCPGHARSLVCFYQPESQVLIGSDHLLGQISSNAIAEPPPPGQTRRGKPLLEYWRSLQRVHDLEITVVLPGHGSLVRNHRQLIQERFRFYEQRLDHLRRILWIRPHTIWELARALFRDLDQVDTFLAVSEVLGHLEVLEERGEVEVENSAAGVWRYRLSRTSVKAPR